jgi:hypothetical protein
MIGGQAAALGTSGLPLIHVRDRDNDAIKK